MKGASDVCERKLMASITNRRSRCVEMETFTRMREGGPWAGTERMGLHGRSQGHHPHIHMGLHGRSKGHHPHVHMGLHGRSKGLNPHIHMGLHERSKGHHPHVHMGLHERSKDTLRTLQGDSESDVSLQQRKNQLTRFNVHPVGGNSKDSATTRAFQMPMNGMGAPTTRCAHEKRET
jgi:hypothetical protein